MKEGTNKKYNNVRMIYVQREYPRWKVIKDSMGKNG